MSRHPEEDFQSEVGQVSVQSFILKFTFYALTVHTHCPLGGSGNTSYQQWWESCCQVKTYYCIY